MSNYKIQIEKILEENAADLIDGVLMDTYSASALLNVYNSLSDENLANFTSKPIVEQVGIAFKILNQLRK